MGAGCCKGAKKNKENKQLNGKEKKNIKSNVKLDKMKSQKKKKNKTDVDTERLGTTFQRRQRRIRINNKAKIHQSVVEAVTNTPGRVTLPRIEAYINDNHGDLPIKPYRRRKVLTKVIANEFTKGNLAVKIRKPYS